jgi:NAD-dependent SIR2 family protein deacetylase
MNYHFEEIPFCTGCKKSFASYKNLERHENICEISLLTRNLAEMTRKYNEEHQKNTQLENRITYLITEGQKIQDLNTVLTEKVSTLHIEGQRVIVQLLNENSGLKRLK